MDKASVLGDAIKYVKSLQDKIKNLEENCPKKIVRTMAVVKKEKNTRDIDDTHEVIEDDNSNAPEIEARMVDKNVLVKLHCEKRKGIVVKALAALETLHLTVVNAYVLSFTSTSFDLTVTCQVSILLLVASSLSRNPTALHQYSPQLAVSEIQSMPS
jgi:hypothetical protein